MIAIALPALVVGIVGAGTAAAKLAWPVVPGRHRMPEVVGGTVPDRDDDHIHPVPVEPTARDYLREAHNAALAGDTLISVDAIISALGVILDMIAPAATAAAVLPMINPLELITCCNPDCGHAAVYHGMIWDPQTGGIRLTDPELGCGVGLCLCPKFDQGEMPEVLAQPGQQD